MPDEVRITIITQKNLRDKEALSKLLDAIEKYPEFLPSHWGHDERTRNVYDRAELLAAVCGYVNDVGRPAFRRRKAPKYSSFFSTDAIRLNNLHMEFAALTNTDRIARVFSLGDDLAEALSAEAGFVHPVWFGDGTENQEYCGSGVLNVNGLQKSGLNPVSPRTWYGPYLIERLGRERLLHSGCIIKETPWGGIQLDLVESPWQSDVTTLFKRQQEVMEQLRPSGVFTIRAPGKIPEPGPGWVPFPRQG